MQPAFLTGIWMNKIFDDQLLSFFGEYNVFLLVGRKKEKVEA